MLVRFQQAEYAGYRLAEFHSLVSLFAPEAEVSFRYYEASRPFAIVDGLTVEQLVLIGDRATTIMSVYEVIAYGESWELTLSSLNEELMAKYNKPELTFKMDALRWGATWPFEERKAMFRHVLTTIGWKCKAQMKNPEHLFTLLEQMKKGHSDGDKPTLELAVFARTIPLPKQRRIEEFRLNRRPYINTTSMAAFVAFAMANIAKIKPGMLVVDPFVGSASVALACSYFGAYCLGCDSDGRVLHGKKGKGKRNPKCITGNYEHYNIPVDRYVGSVRADFSHFPIRPTLKLDAIVTDPPYGVRESIKRVGMKAPNRANMTAEEIVSKYGEQHIPQRVRYEYKQLIEDLMEFASLSLIPRGRLVFFLAIDPEKFSKENDTPSHPQLEYISESHEVFANFTRILYCFERKVE